MREESTPLLRSSQSGGVWDPPSRYKARFQKFTLITALNRASDNVVVAYYTSALGNCGSIGLGCMFVAQALFSLTFAKLFVRLIGCKHSLSCAHLGFALFCLGFYSGAFLEFEYELLKWIIVLASAIIGGISVAIWWTAQGEYYALSVDMIYHSSASLAIIEDTNIDKVKNSIRSDLAARWTLVYLSIDVSLKLFGTLVTYKYSMNIYFIGVCIIAFGTVLLGQYFIEDIEQLSSDAATNSTSHGHTETSPKHTHTGTKHHFPSSNHITTHSKSSSTGTELVLVFFLLDMRIKLIAMFFVAYGTCQAMIAYYIDGYVIAAADSNLGVMWVGALAAISTAVAAVSAPVFNVITKKFALGRFVLVIFACLCFLTLGLMALLLSNDQLAHWSLIISYKALWGCGRGVYENTFKVILTDTFDIDERQQAFGVQVMVLGLSCGLFLFVFPYIERVHMAEITVGASIAAIVCFLGFMKIRHSYSMQQTNINQRPKEIFDTESESGDREGTSEVSPTSASLHTFDSTFIHIDNTANKVRKTNRLRDGPLVIDC